MSNARTLSWGSTVRLGTVRLGTVRLGTVRLGTTPLALGATR